MDRLRWLWYDTHLFLVYRPRRFFTETLPRKIAWLLPRRIALWTFIRVYAAGGDIGPDYERCYKAWEAGAGR